MAWTRAGTCFRASWKALSGGSLLLDRYWARSSGPSSPLHSWPASPFRCLMSSSTLALYHQFTRLVDKLSKLINVICGIIYLYTPFFISQILWQLTEEEPKNILENFAKLFFLFVVIIIITSLYIFDDIISSITKFNRKLPNYLYPIFHNKHFTRFDHRISFNLNYNFGQLSDIMVRIKIDSFIARLNEEFVGFYFFNLFKVTKLAFFQYIYIILTVISF